MPSIQELIDEIRLIKQASEGLSASVAAAGHNLDAQGNVIAALVRGSYTGQEAVSVVHIASQALADAAASMTALGHTCDHCVQSLSK